MKNTHYAAHYAVEDVVPHAGPMCLLDEIVSFGDNCLLATLRIRTDALFFDGAGVPAWVGIEYMAQAVAALAGIRARQRGEPVQIGFLVGSRRYHCNCSEFPLDSTLEISVEQLIEGSNGLNVFQCLINGSNIISGSNIIDGSNIKAEARLNVFAPDDPDVFLQETTHGGDSRNKHPEQR